MTPEAALQWIESHIGEGLSLHSDMHVVPAAFAVSVVWLREGKMTIASGATLLDAVKRAAEKEAE